MSVRRRPFREWYVKVFAAGLSVQRLRGDQISFRGFDFEVETASIPAGDVVHYPNGHHTARRLALFSELDTVRYSRSDL